MLKNQRGVFEKNALKASIEDIINLNYCYTPPIISAHNALVLAAENAGATVLNYCEVSGLRESTGQAGHVLQMQDTLTGKDYEVQARLVVNAGGPFVDNVNLNLKQAVGRKMGGTKGSHLIMKRFEGGPREAIYVEARQDGRPYFIIPWLDYYLVGTTDIFYDGDMNEVHATEAEIKYLLYELNQLIPGHAFNRKDVLYTYSGIRPLPYEPGKKERSVTRRHIILDHAKAGGSPGVFSIIGGKLTTYRSLAEDTADVLMHHLGRKVPCATRHQLLPGGDLGAESIQAIQVLANRYQVRDATVQHLIEFYGSRSREVLEQIGTWPELAALVTEGRPEIMAEVAYAVRADHACTLKDVYFRRTSIGAYADRSVPAVQAIAELVSNVLEWSSEYTQKQIQSITAQTPESSVHESIPV